MVITLDPAHRRVIETSVPRDLWVRIDAWPDGRTYEQKINAAYEVGVVDSDWRGKSPQYSGRDGGGHLAEHVLGKVTGLQFDRYVGVDFKAFRDVVDALGGVDVHMDGPLDDCHYPDYHDGYMNHGVPPGYRCPRGAGIHFKAGDYAVNGEQALELARSRDATQPEQASDFGRSRRQQMLTAAIKKKSLSANGIAKALPLMTALESNFRTDMDINDIKALYDWGAGIPESAFVHVALTNADLLDEAGGCAQGGVYALCPEDASYRMLHAYVAATAVDPKIPAEKAPLQVVNGSNNSPDLGDRVNKSLQPLGFVLSDPARKRAVEHSVIYDYSGGKYPLTAAWMAAFFNAQVVPVDPAAPLPTGAGQKTDGLVVVLGHDFALRWYGLTR
jgi:anionic cell wall polymer biosynthesis LytR-Cps2A-Psr (LCP) family protein